MLYEVITRVSKNRPTAGKRRAQPRDDDGAAVRRGGTHVLRYFPCNHTGEGTPLHPADGFEHFPSKDHFEWCDERRQFTPFEKVIRTGRPPVEGALILEERLHDEKTARPKVFDEFGYARTIEIIEHQEIV